MYKCNLKSHRVQHYQRHYQQTLGVKMASVRLTWLRQPIKTGTCVEATFLYLWLCRVYNPNGISIGWAVFCTAHFAVTDRPTDRPYANRSVTTGRINVRMPRRLSRSEAWQPPSLKPRQPTWLVRLLLSTSIIADQTSQVYGSLISLSNVFITCQAIKTHLINTDTRTWSRGFLLSLASPQDQMSSRGPAGFSHVYSTTDPLSSKCSSDTFLHKHKIV